MLGGSLAAQPEHETISVNRIEITSFRRAGFVQLLCPILHPSYHSALLLLRNGDDTFTGDDPRIHKRHETGSCISGYFVDRLPVGL